MIVDIKLKSNLKIYLFYFPQYSLIANVTEILYMNVRTHAYAWRSKFEKKNERKKSVHEHGKVHIYFTFPSFSDFSFRNKLNNVYEENEKVKKDFLDNFTFQPYHPFEV